MLTNYSGANVGILKGNPAAKYAADISPASSPQKQLITQSRPSALFSLTASQRLAYDEYGDAEGYPLLCFHDAGSSRLMASFFDNSAREKGFRLLAIDRPGIGWSDYVSMQVPEEFCEQVLALLRHLNIHKAGVLSLGNGGIYAITLAHLAPEIISNQIIMGGVSRAVFKDQSRSPAVAYLDLLTPTFIRLMVRLRHSLGSRDPQKALRNIADHLSYTDKKLMRDPGIFSTLEHDHSEALRQGLRGVAQDIALGFNKLPFSLQDLKVPAMIWHGSADRFSSRADCEYLARRIPNASLHRVNCRGYLFFIRSMDEMLGRLRHAINEVDGLAA